jgi:hypothetical protein
VPAECFFCAQLNPDGSKFCNQCAEPLDLAACPHCKAINDKLATACHKCKAALPWQQTLACTGDDSAALVEADSGSPARDQFSRDERHAPWSTRLDRSLAGSDSTPQEQSTLGKHRTDTVSLDSVSGFVGSRRPSALLSKFRWRGPKLIIIGISLALITAVGSYAYRHWIMGSELPRGAATEATTDRSSRHNAEAPRKYTTSRTVSNSPAGTGQGPPNAAIAQPERPTGDAMFLQQSVHNGQTQQQPMQPPQCDNGIVALGLCAVPSVQTR